MIDSTVSTVQVSGHDRNSHRTQWSESPGMMAGRLLMGGCRSAAGGLGARGPAVAGRRRHVSTAQVRAELRDHVIGQHAGRAQRRPTPGHSPTAAPAARRTYPSINQSRNATSNLATSRGLHVARQQQLSIDICCRSAPDLSSKPAGGRSCCRSTGQTDGRTDT